MSSKQPTSAAQQLRLPSRLFFRIGEVSKLTGLEPYVLRYWETEFPHLQPEKRRSGQRLYTKKDVDNILQIKQLLYRDGFTISGARKRLRGRSVKETGEVLRAIKQEIGELLEMLK